MDATAVNTTISARFGLSKAEESEARKERLTKISATMAVTSEKKARARTSFYGIPLRIARR